MKYTKIVIPALTAVCLAVAALPVQADTVHADCVMHKKGEKAKQGTGPCTFSQRQGYIDIKLKNGKVFSLKPGKKGGHYKDQEGHTVVRMEETASSVKFKWEHANIVVHWRD